MEHWLTKCYLFKKFRDAGWVVLSEYFINPRRKPDLMIITERSAFVAEVETDMRNITKHKGIGVNVYPVQATLKLSDVDEKAKRIIDHERNSFKL